VCEDSVGAQKSESFKDSRVNSGGVAFSYAQARTQSHGAHRGNRTKFEAFEPLELFQDHEESTKA
jgi:hypothetical protein